MRQNIWLFINIFWLVRFVVAGSSIDSIGSFNCAPDANDATIRVTDFKFKFDKESSTASYTATGTAKETVNATAKITLYVYGIKAIEREVKFCEYGVSELCPIKKNTDITITGNHSVPAKYVSSISNLAFSIPDIEGNIYIELYDVDDPSKKYGCFRSDITNGNTAEVKSAKWGTAIAAIIALLVAMTSAASSSQGGSINTATAPTDGGAASGPGTNVASNGFHAPGLAVLVGWLQTMSINGLYSIHYPKVYRSFTRNFSWTCGILEWEGLEKSIDRLRKNTGGNLTLSSVPALKNTTIYEDPLATSQLNSLQALGANASKRSVDDSFFVDDYLIKRAISSIPTTGDSTTSVYSKYVTGVEAYLEKNNIPFTNGFATLLIWWCIIVVVIIVVILAFKAFLELYYTEERMARIQQKLEEYENSVSSRNNSSFTNRNNGSRGSRLLTRLSFVDRRASMDSAKKPLKPKFQEFRKNYKTFLRLTMIRVILILYGVWVLLTLYQFRISDSWATTLLAALTFSVFTLVLMAYAVRIWYLAYVASKKRLEKEAQAAEKIKGPEVLFTHKPWISRYGVFYDEFKVKFWWFFIPSILAVFGRNAFIALGVGHGLIQIFGQLAIDVLLCAFFCIFMPFNTKMGNGLNILIQVVRIISLILTFLFTDVVALNRIKSTIIGFVLIALQSSMTVLLVILIIANAFKGILNSYFESLKKKRLAKKLSKQTIEKHENASRIQTHNSLFNDADDNEYTHQYGRNSIQLIDLDSPTGSPARSSNVSPKHRLDDINSTGNHTNVFLGNEETSENSLHDANDHFSDAQQDIFSDAAAIKTNSQLDFIDINNTHNIFDAELLARDDRDFDFLDIDSPKTSDKHHSNGFNFENYEAGSGIGITRLRLSAISGDSKLSRPADNTIRGFDDQDDSDSDSDDDVRLLRK